MRDEEVPAKKMGERRYEGKVGGKGKDRDDEDKEDNW